MLTSSKTKAVNLNELMSAVIKDPTDDVSFVPHSIWILLPPYKKDEFHDMQQNFANNYNALKLQGIKNLSLTISDNMQVGTSTIMRTVSILDWIKSFKTKNGQKLFYKVLNSLHSKVEILYDLNYRQECLACIKSALSQIARRSGINLNTEYDRLAEMFIDP
jgi:hypothetical protein